MENFEPKIVAFACNWCSYAASDVAGTSRFAYPPNVRIIRTMCSGMVDPVYILKAFEEGADGVLVMGCRPGDCHYLSGNDKAQKRVAKLKILLHRLGFQEERLKLQWVSTGEGKLFADTIAEMVKQLKEMGPSPLKKQKVLQKK